MYFKKYLKLSIGFTLLLLVIRIAVSNRLHYIFLPWNLFLAFIPLWISTNRFQINKTPSTSNVISYFNQLNQWYIFKKLNQLKLTIGDSFWFITWLLFLPNAPYIITDLTHLTERAPIPYYFDIVLLFMSAANGLIFFFVSVSQVENWWRHQFSKSTLGWFYFIAFGLCSFGIYLGRYGRFNSWNVLTNPTSLLSEILDRIVMPFEHPRTWAVTFLFTVMLYLLYMVAKNVKFTEVENQ
jgi:uncharacterized membrane protein